MSFDEHTNGQLRIGTQGDQIPLLPLPDEQIPESDGPELASREASIRAATMTALCGACGETIHKGETVAYYRSRGLTVHGRCE